MSTTGDEPRHQTVPHRIGWFVVGFASATLGALLGVIVTMSWAEVAANRGVVQDAAVVASELRAIAASLESHHQSRGRYPESFDEWRDTETDLDDLLTTKSASTAPRYFIDLTALGDPSRIVTMTPDRDLDRYIPDVPLIPWRMLMRSAQRLDSRYVLLGDLGGHRSGADVDLVEQREFAYRAGWSFDEREP